MVGVQDLRECPQCHDQAHYEYQTRDGTESLFCPRCGYEKHSTCFVDRKREKETGQNYGTGVTSLCRFTCGGELRDKMIAKLKALRRRGLTVNITLVDGDKITEA